MTVEDLREFGAEEMSDEEVCDFLASQRSGVLALPDGDLAYPVVLSYGYDRGDALYFTYLGDGRKDRLSERADRARFLVYEVTSAFVWESVLVTGTLERVPEADWDDLPAAAGNVWRPALFERASDELSVSVYRLTTAGWSSLRQVGLPPGLRGEEG